MIFPWQQEQWQQLWRAKQENRLPHALLCTGMAGIGKTQFIEEFVRAYCCTQSSDNLECACHSCRLIENKSHPNVLWMQPEKIGSAIKVDQIREVSEFVQLTSLQDAFRIVVINPADAMNTNAANALLKTLEEPADGALIILISNYASQLPATVLSRCQRLVLSRPSTELGLNWLKKQLADEEVDAEL